MESIFYWRLFSDKCPSLLYSVKWKNMTKQKLNLVQWIVVLPRMGRIYVLCVAGHKTKTANNPVLWISILPRIGRIWTHWTSWTFWTSIWAIRQKHKKPLAVDARCLLRAIDAVPVWKSSSKLGYFQPAPPSPRRVLHPSQGDKQG